MLRYKLAAFSALLIVGLSGSNCAAPLGFDPWAGFTTPNSLGSSDGGTRSVSTSLPALVGVAFQPYVGAWQNGSTPAWNSYSQSFVTGLLQKVQQSGYTTIRTYGAGWSYWTSQPNGTLDSNQYNVPAAAGLGMKVLLGCALMYNGGHLDVANSQNEINTAIAQAKASPGTVIGLIVSNEAVGTNGVSVSDIVSLMSYAKTQRTAAGFTATTLPVTVCERWGVLAGDTNKGLSQAAEGFVVANLYPFFDPGTTIDTSITDLNTNYTTLRNNLNNWGLSGLQLVIGESGWASAGVNTINPQAIPSPANQQRYTQMLTQWANQQSVPTFIFEAYNEPWKTNPTTDPNGVEAHFGILTTP